MRYSIIFALATTAVAAPVVESPLDRTCPKYHTLFEKLSTNSEELLDPAVNKAAFQVLDACCDTAAFNFPMEKDPLCSLKPLNKRQLPAGYCTNIAEKYDCVDDGVTEPEICYDMLHDCCVKSANVKGFNLALDPICTSDMSPTKLATLQISTQSAAAKRQENAVCLATKESCLKEGSTRQSCLLKASDCCIATKSTELVCRIEFLVTKGTLSLSLGQQATREEYVCTAAVVECALEGTNLNQDCFQEIKQCCLTSENVDRFCSISEEIRGNTISAVSGAIAEIIAEDASQGE